MHGIRGNHADPVAPLVVSVTRGHLDKLHVKCSTCKHHKLRGHIVHHAKAWVSNAAPPAGAKLRVFGIATDRAGERRKLQKITARVASEETILSPIMSPHHQTVGVGQPIIVVFNHPVIHKAAVEKRLEVRASRHVKGSWRWLSDNVLHYRPKHLWPAHTHVSVTANLGDVWLRGQWGESDHHISFDIGAAQISTVDVTAHQMVVRRDGVVVRTIPVSTGRAEYPTAGGIHIVLAKTPEMIMDSATVGIPRDSPDGYYETVYWDTRISNSGEFVHAAPWSVDDQGSANVSHGCVNISTEAGRWFYYFSQIGDVVNVVNSVRPPVTTDAGMADWNMSWSDWKAGSALH
jgi:lipoprotein-anchoring transpeptidase ErfK/SrfK